MGKARGARAEQERPVAEKRYRREQILQMAAYQPYTDAVMALLRPEGRYTTEEVDANLHQFLTKEAT